MRYMILIYWNQLNDAAMTPAEREAQYAAYGAFTQEIQERKVMVDGDALEPTSVATTGVPQASASMTELGQPSLRLGRQKTSTAFCQTDICS